MHPHYVDDHLLSLATVPINPTLSFLRNRAYDRISFICATHKEHHRVTRLPAGFINHLIDDTKRRLCLPFQTHLYRSTIIRRMKKFADPQPDHHQGTTFSIISVFQNC